MDDVDVTSIAEISSKLEGMAKEHALKQGESRPGSEKDSISESMDIYLEVADTNVSQMDKIGYIFVKYSGFTIE